MSFQLSDVVVCATLAWNVYKIGFSKYESASAFISLLGQHFGIVSFGFHHLYSSVLGQEYADFGNDIHHFAQGLDSIREAVERAKGQAPSFATTDWDLTSLQSIVGDFSATIKQCDELVLRNPNFKKRTAS